MTSREQRIADLEFFAAEEGLTLPWPAAVIAELEEQGHIVDLTTGMVEQNGSEQRVSLTVIGEAVAVANKRWGGNDV
jgi:hypothetical protein